MILCRVLSRTGIELQLTRSTRRHNLSPVLAVFNNSRARESERRASLVCTGHERVLDEWVEKTGSDRRYRRGARGKKSG